MAEKRAADGAEDLYEQAARRYEHYRNDGVISFCGGKKGTFGSGLYAGYARGPK